MTLLDASRSKPSEGGPSFSLQDRLTRLAWNITWLLAASWTPRHFHPWRRFLLRLFGARMAPHADVRGSASVWKPSNLVMQDRAVIGPRARCYNMGPIQIGARALVSQDACLLAGSHDIEDVNFQLVTKEIRLGADSWIAAHAIVGPGVTVGEGAVLGAGAVAFRDLDPWTVYVGNPARPVKKRGRGAG